MKRIVSQFAALLLACTFTTSFAQIRLKKEVLELVKSAPRTEGFPFFADFVSLKDIDSTKLTGVEKNLMLTFEHVAFAFHKKRIFCCYWVKDKDNNTGLVKFDGTLLVPPIKGNVYFGTKRDVLLVGEESIATVDDWLIEFRNRVTTYSGIGLGHFASVIGDVEDEQKIHAIIPAGKYDDIMLAIKGARTFYFVAKLIDGEMKWGVVDADDKEVMPIEHKGIYKKKGASDLFKGMGGKWESTETMDMSEVENMVINRETIAKQRKEQILASVGAFGNLLVNVGNSLDQTQHTNSDASGNTSAGGSDGSFESQYRKWEHVAKRHYNSLTNLGVQVKVDDKDVGGTAGQGMSPTNYTNMKKALRKAQKEMQSIRKKASAKGINIKKSEYEDIRVVY